MELNNNSYKKIVIEKLKAIESLNFNSKVKAFKEIFELEKSIFTSKNALDKFIKIILKLLEDNNSNFLKENENAFFKTNNHEEIFYLLHFEKNFDKELGINKFHYGNKELAKKWKKNMMKKYHPDISKEFGLDDETINLLGQNINKIYKRLVGEK